MLQRGHVSEAVWATHQQQQPDNCLQDLRRAESAVEQLQQDLRVAQQALSSHVGPCMRCVRADCSLTSLQEVTVRDMKATLAQTTDKYEMRITELAAQLEHHKADDSSLANMLEQVLSHSISFLPLQSPAVPSPGSYIAERIAQRQTRA